MPDSAAARWSQEAPVLAPPRTQHVFPAELADVRRKWWDYEKGAGGPLFPGSWPIVFDWFWWDVDPDAPGDPNTAGEWWDSTHKWGR